MLRSELATSLFWCECACVNLVLMFYSCMPKPIVDRILGR